MRTEDNDTGIIYHGRRQEYGAVITLESPGGEHVGILRHVVRHSPSGMNWGYRGSGPCDTALSLLIDALGDDALCLICQGTLQVVYSTEGERVRAEPFDPARHPWTRRGWPCTCSDGHRDVPYMQFAEVVAAWGAEWIMSRSSILTWLQESRTAPS